MSFLFVIQGNDQGCRFELREDTISIGRETTNIFQLHDPEISRKHAEIRRSDKFDVLFDAGSSNGLFVNGQRIKKYALRTGDQIQLGRTLLLYTRMEEEGGGEPSDRIEVEIHSETERPASAIIESIFHDEGTWFFDGTFESSGESPASDGEHKDTWLKKARGHLKMMYHTALVVSQTLDTDRLLNRMIDLIFDWVNIDHACVMLYDQESKKLIPKVSRTRDSGREQPLIRISQTILDYVMQRGEGVLTNNAGIDKRWDPGASIISGNIREAICVPMRGRYGIVGVIYIDTVAWNGLNSELSGPNRKLNRDHLKLMGAIAHQAALAVEDTRYYRAMVQAERLAAVGQTVAVLSHDIKNILQGISGGSFLIEKGLANNDSEQIAKGWNIVQKNQNKISDLILDMLTFSKEREPMLAYDNINRIVSDAVELMQSRSEEKKVQLSWTADLSIPQFCFDHQQISRAVVNIITNAIDAARERAGDGTRESTEDSEEKARVDVSTQLDEPFSRVEILVDDNGSGIPPDQMDLLFRPFQSTKRGRGTGLGLAVTQKILQEHNGSVKISTSPIGGTRFVLELPLLMSVDAVRPKTGEHGGDTPENAPSPP